MITRGTKTVGVVSILYFALASVLVVMAFIEVRGLGTDLQEEVRIVANSEAFKQQAAAGAKVIEETQTVRNQLNSHLLTEDETINFLADIEAAAVAQGVSLSTKSLNLIEVTDSNFNTLTATFTFAGSRDAVFRMIKIFENLPYKSTVTKLGYEEQEGSVNGDITIDLSIASYDN